MTDDDQKLGPPPVEPMSDVSWARIERGLWSRVDGGATDVVTETPHRRWLWLALPALAVAAVLAILVGSGLVTSREEAPAVAWVEPSEPSRVVAGAAPTAVSFGDAHIDLAAESAIVMSREGGSPSVLLERGVATFAVAPRADRPPFIVRAGDTVVRVVGTRFVVSRSNEQITVAVEHGLVDVQFRGATQRVSAGQIWSSDSPFKVALHAASGAPDTDPIPTNLQANTSDTQPPDAHITSDTRAKTPDARTTPDRRPKALDTHTSSPKKTDVRGTAGMPDARMGSASPASAAVGSMGTSVDVDRATYDRLTTQERRDPKAALTGYLELSRGHSKWAAVALFAAGRLAADRNDHRAVTFLDIYLRRFPDGANADDARNLLARLKGDAP